MFTGLIQKTARVRSVTPRAAGIDITVECDEPIENCRVGDSINCNGCCLTVTDLNERRFTVHAGTETIQRSTVEKWQKSTIINIETALTADGKLGGHFVQGHVDGVGNITEIEHEGATSRWRFTVPDDLSIYLAEKGSIAIDGISLTITEVADPEFTVAVIPHTLRNTNLRSADTGQSVNIEVDILAKYVHKMLQQTRQEQSGVTEQLLRDQGFC